MYQLASRLTGIIHYLKAKSWRFARTYRRPFTTGDRAGLRGYAYLPDKKILFAVDTTCSLIDDYLPDISGAMYALSKYTLLMATFSEEVTIHKNILSIKKIQKEENQPRLVPVLNLANKEKVDVLIIASDFNFSDTKDSLNILNNLKSHIIVIYTKQHSNTFEKFASKYQKKIINITLN